MNKIADGSHSIRNGYDALDVGLAWEHMIPTNAVIDYLPMGSESVVRITNNRGGRVRHIYLSKNEAVKMANELINCIKDMG